MLSTLGATAQNTTDVMVVFDASESMWRQVGGRTKIEALSVEGYGELDIMPTSSEMDIRIPFAANKATFETADNGPYELGHEQRFYLTVHRLQENGEYSIALYP